MFHETLNIENMWKWIFEIPRELRYVTIENFTVYNENEKLIFILLCFPLIGFGQDVPLTDKKITTDKMEEKNRKLKKKKERKYNKSLAMKPAAQIGYILNPTENPFGLSFFFFNLFLKILGSILI
ncbi:MAG: hypothetical protein CM15mP112_00110 [Flavobacteriales bacterium]|nr:MAG: hypothetical protein CM15mP112_00110 [Flavobacteriales bacterium]